MRSSYGRTLLAVGDNPEAAASPAPRSGGPRPGRSCSRRCRPPSRASCSSGTPACTRRSARATSSRPSPPSCSAASCWAAAAAGCSRPRPARSRSSCSSPCSPSGRRVDVAQHRAGHHHHPRRGRLGPRLDSRASPALPFGRPIWTHRTRGGPHCPATTAAGHRHRRTLMRRKSIRGAAGGRGGSPAGGARPPAARRPSPTRATTRPTPPPARPPAEESRGRGRASTEWFDQARLRRAGRAALGDLRG